MPHSFLAREPDAFSFLSSANYTLTAQSHVSLSSKHALHLLQWGFVAILVSYLHETSMTHLIQISQLGFKIPDIFNLHLDKSSLNNFVQLGLAREMFQYQQKRKKDLWLH